MADKYVDVSLTTGNNDGTSKADAWQSLVDVLDGNPTNGSVDAGDVIHIRTADGSGNLSESYTGTLTTPTQTGAEDNPVRWVFDDGTEWSESGTFILQKDQASWNVYGGNVIEAGTLGNHRLKVVVTSASTDEEIFILRGGAKAEGVWFQRGTGLASNRDFFISYYREATDENTIAEYIDCKINLLKDESGSGVSYVNGVIKGAGAGNVPRVRFINCDFYLYPDLTGAALIDPSNDRGALIEFIGCHLKDTATDHKIFKGYGTGLYGGNYRFLNCDLGLIDVASVQMGSAVAAAWNVVFDGLNGKTDFYIMKNTGIARWDENGNYPTLNARLPDGTAWSVLVWPDSNKCNESNPFRFPITHKIITSSTGVKTVTVELLIKDTTAFANPQKDEWWMEVIYIDDSGNIRIEDTKESGALDTSTAGWSSTTYGANSYDKYKLELTTSNQVKQYSVMRVIVYSNVPAINSLSSASGDFYFIDPDVSVS